MRHQKTLEQQMFPQGFPHTKIGGETNKGDKCVITPVGVLTLNDVLTIKTKNL